MNVAIQPCGDSVGRQHYVDTIKNLITPDRIRPYLTSQQLTDFNSRLGGAVAVWGVTHGENGQNRKKWEKLKFGDIALLYRDKKIFSQGRIAFTLNNATLASKLWSVREDGSTWENVYFLDDIQEIDVSVARFNKALGYKENYIVQGFNVYEGEKAQILLELLEVEHEAHEAGGSIDPAALRERLRDLQALDIATPIKKRQENEIFRQILFGRKKAERCDICGRVFPIGLLIAAHIKQRKSATDEERRNPRIVMSACALGCDDLFERSYVYVSAKGEIEINTASMIGHEDLRQYAQTLEGRICTAHNSETEVFFRWHREHLRRFAT
jgi:hypothetical protein